MNFLMIAVNNGPNPIVEVRCVAWMREPKS